MIPKYQQKPNECFAACVASILECPVDRVPVADVPNGSPLPKEYEAALNAWLAERGCGGYVEFGFPGNLAWILGQMAEHGYQVHYILTGTNHKGAVHSVLCRGGEIIHDPSSEPDSYQLV